MFVVQHLPIAIVFCVISMLGWGPSANTQKLADLGGDMLRNSLPQSTRTPRQRLLGVALSLALVLAGGVFLNYLIYRLSVPVEPFIYVSF